MSSKTDMVQTKSHRCLGSEFHVIGPATEKTRRPYEWRVKIQSRVTGLL